MSNDNLVLMTSDPVPVAKIANAMGILATMKSADGEKVKTVIDKAIAAGVSLLAIIKAILAHARDISGIIAAIEALIAQLMPPAPVPPTPVAE